MRYGTVVFLRDGRSTVLADDQKAIRDSGIRIEMLDEEEQVHIEKNEA
jgi:hypothetical protein